MAGPLDGWAGRCAGRPVRDPRRWAPLALAAGATALTAGAFLTPPWVNCGLAVAGAGAVVGLAPLWRLPGMLAGALYSLWVAISVVTAWSAGIPGAEPAPPGAAFVWLATPLVAVGLAGREARRHAIRIVLAVAAAAAILAIVQFCVGVGQGPGSLRLLKIDPDGERLRIARGFSEHHLTFGLLCAMLTVASAQPRSVWAAGAAAAWTARCIALAGLAVCGSRAAMLGALAGVWASFSVRGRRYAMVGIAVVLVLGGGLAARQYATDRGRFTKTVELRDGRWPIWRTSWHLAGQRPILGLGGKDAFKEAYREAYPVVNPGVRNEFPNGAGHAHNAALSLVAEYGLPALALQVAFWTAVLAWLWRRRRTAPDAWRLGVGVAAMAAVGGLFEPYCTRVMQGVAIHAALGLAVALALDPAPAADPPGHA